jgi:hypothetical protein
MLWCCSENLANVCKGGCHLSSSWLPANTVSVDTAKQPDVLAPAAEASNRATRRFAACLLEHEAHVYSQSVSLGLYSASRVPVCSIWLQCMDSTRLHLVQRGAHKLPEAPIPAEVHMKSLN